MGIALVIIILIVVAIIIFGPGFVSQENVFTLLRNCSVTILVGFAQMVVIGGGGLNVSVGGIGGLSAVLVGAFIQRAGIPWEFAILIGIMIGALAGALNGLIITRLGGKSEISWLVTLATMSIFTGINLTIVKTKQFFDLPEGYNWIGAYNIFGWIPLMIVISVLFAIVLWWLFKYNSFGRQILAVRSNPKAAQLSGINVNKVIFIKHIISAVIASCAGILVSTRIGAINADIGQDWMLFSFAAPLIGGTRMEGGRVNITGAFLGGLLLILVQNIVVHLGLQDVYITELIQGIIIFIAVGLDRVRMLNEERRERLERARI
jgi:ribose transport system permease protein